MYVLTKSGPSLQNLVSLNICAATAARSGPGLGTAKPGVGGTTEIVHASS